jgi:hypothetical protein
MTTAWFPKGFGREGAPKGLVKEGLKREQYPG